MHPVRLAQVARGRGKRWAWSSRGGVTTSCLECTVNRCAFTKSTFCTGGGFTPPGTNFSLAELLQCGLQKMFDFFRFFLSLMFLRCFVSIRGVSTVRHLPQQNITTKVSGKHVYTQKQHILHNFDEYFYNKHKSEVKVEVEGNYVALCLTCGMENIKHGVLEFTVV